MVPIYILGKYQDLEQVRVNYPALSAGDGCTVENHGKYG